MAQDSGGNRRLADIALHYGVFHESAYAFVLEGLELATRGQTAPRHVSGGDLLDAIKSLARDRYGVMATDVFESWGVRSTLDFGRIVFQMVEDGLLSKQDEDSLTEFIDRFDFRQVFEVEYFQGEA
jgi:uncharacterized repeat protein (TIGR04138 family)